MSNSEEPRRDRDAARRKAQNHFTASEQRDTLVRQELEKERTALATRTAKLKALRLAKEAEDRIVAERRSAEKAEAKKEAEAARAGARRAARRAKH